MTAEKREKYEKKAERLKQRIKEADAIVIGAGAGLSNSAGFDYSGGRFLKYFGDFIEIYHFQNMYEGGFYPFKSLEEYWAYWSRYIYMNRYVNAPKPVYETLRKLVENKEYFVLTTNVDHCFQKAGFDKNRLFYTQGDYGLFQCSVPCHKAVYDNKDAVFEMLEAQGYAFREGGELRLPEGSAPKMAIPSKLVPRCPKCGKPMGMNLRADDTFVENEGWHQAAGRYGGFLRKYQHTKVLFFELAVGYNTPGIIKYPFWKMTAENPNAAYVCVNYKEAFCPKEIAHQSICIEDDIGQFLQQLIKMAG